MSFLFMLVYKLQNINQPIELNCLMSYTKGWIVQASLNSIFEWNNSWSDIIYLPTELMITRASYSWESEGQHQKINYKLLAKNASTNHTSIGKMPKNYYVGYHDWN